MEEETSWSEYDGEKTVVGLVQKGMITQQQLDEVNYDRSGNYINICYSSN